jgi:hypothetical protein
MIAPLFLQHAVDRIIMNAQRAAGNRNGRGQFGVAVPSTILDVCARRKAAGSGSMVRTPRDLRP